MPPKKKLSEKPSAVASRQRRAEAAVERARAKVAGSEDPPADPAAKPSTASIGVQSPEKPAAKAAQLYHCPNCDEDVTMAMPECPTCGTPFNWPKG